MNKLLKVMTLALLVAFVAGFATVANAQNNSIKAPTTVEPVVYVATNLDQPSDYGTNAVSILKNSGTTLVPFGSSPFSTGSYGLGGGYFATPRVDVQATPGGVCAFVADAGGTSGSGPGDIAAYTVADITGNTLPTLYTSGAGGNGYSLGIGLEGADIGGTYYLVATWTENGVVELFEEGSGCTLTSVASTTATGLGGGQIDSTHLWEARGPTSVDYVAYADGSAGTCTVNTSPASISCGTPAYLNCYNTLSAIPVSVAVTTDGYVVWECLYGGGPVFDTAAVATPLTTTTYGPLNANGNFFGGNSFVLTPNNANIYAASNDEYGTVATLAYSGGGVVASTSCPAVNMTGWDSTWYYPGTINVATTSGTGAAVILTEASFGFSTDSFVGVAKIGTGGCPAEVTGSPFSIGNLSGDTSYFALSSSVYFT